MQAHSNCWGQIWKLNVPPKVRNFIWRACSHCLPTYENLHKEKVPVEAVCEICCQAPETVTHVLWECSFTCNVWSLFKGTTQKCSNQAEYFFLKTMKQKLSATELEKWSTIAWVIWNASNQFYFKHVQVHLKMIFEGALGLIEEYQCLMSRHL